MNCSNAITTVTFYPVDTTQTIHNTVKFGHFIQTFDCYLHVQIAVEAYPYKFIKLYKSIDRMANITVKERESLWQVAAFL